MLYVLICCQFWTPCVYSCTFRAKIRSKFGLPDAPAPDWITHCFCEYCALCQEYRELKNRGLDPSIGKLSTVYEFQSQIIYQSTLLSTDTIQPGSIPKDKKPHVPSLKRLMAMNKPEYEKKALYDCLSAASDGGIQQFTHMILDQWCQFLTSQNEITERTRI
ncbi:unnamed protein product [Brassica napus]|nr:unnamed protein product [Brassica napus]